MILSRMKAILPSSSQARKDTPIVAGVLDYFPAAIAEVARVSKAGNDQHNPGQPLHWARGKSTDHADCIARHLVDRGTFDSDGQRHTAKVAWRALALLQEELEDEGAAPGRGSKFDAEDPPWDTSGFYRPPYHECSNCGAPPTLVPKKPRYEPEEDLLGNYRGTRGGTI
jgi:hypothetical protein